TAVLSVWAFYVLPRAKTRSAAGKPKGNTKNGGKSRRPPFPPRDTRIILHFFPRRMASRGRRRRWVRRGQKMGGSPGYIASLRATGGHSLGSVPQIPQAPEIGAQRSVGSAPSE